MPTVLAEKSFHQVGRQIDEPLNDVRSNLVSPGGALILAVTIVLTLFLAMSLVLPALDGLQTAIFAMLAFVCWGYLLNCSSEKLRLEDGVLQYRAMMGRSHSYPLEIIRGFRLTDLGVSLNGSMYVLEISLEDKTRPVQISLGPCWKKRDLVKFIKTLGQNLERY